ncbi:hypothetical protein JTE90_023689 [Oedothorax gibbosus]|uniref:Uncharacterized protein n=1 Tax=Oedothorax gibbosus TaxID=931172 RepID=A0AAV6TY77_9ARAC|nr:hypothetical protein JTE90_023689 [Oedothorax gibbosus]
MFAIRSLPVSGLQNRFFQEHAQNPEEIQRTSYLQLLPCRVCKHHNTARAPLSALQLRQQTAVPCVYERIPNKALFEDPHEDAYSPIFVE